MDASGQEGVGVLLLGDGDVGKSVLLSRFSALKDGTGVKQLPVLRDSEQPFCFDVRLSRKSYRLELYDTAAPSSYLLLQPAVLVLCFSIADRDSLRSLHTTWKDIVEKHFNSNDQIPVIVLGLKRDLREVNNPNIIHANEAIKIAQEMRCDKYCECSALTGDLCPLVFEDIAKTAVATTTAQGGRSEGPTCVSI